MLPKPSGGFGRSGLGAALPTGGFDRRAPPPPSTLDQKEEAWRAGKTGLKQKKNKRSIRPVLQPARVSPVRTPSYGPNDSALGECGGGGQRARPSQSLLTAPGPIAQRADCSSTRPAERWRQCCCQISSRWKRNPGVLARCAMDHVAAVPAVEDVQVPCCLAVQPYPACAASKSRRLSSSFHPTLPERRRHSSHVYLRKMQKPAHGSRRRHNVPSARNGRMMASARELRPSSHAYTRISAGHR